MTRLVCPPEVSQSLLKRYVGHPQDVWTGYLAGPTAKRYNDVLQYHGRSRQDLQPIKGWVVTSKSVLEANTQNPGILRYVCKAEARYTEAPRLCA